jgi:hypothetical protein
MPEAIMMKVDWSFSDMGLSNTTEMKFQIKIKAKPQWIRNTIHIVNPLHSGRLSLCQQSQKEFIEA